MDREKILVSASGKGHSDIVTWWIVGVIGAVIGIIIGYTVATVISGGHSASGSDAYNVFIGFGILFSIVCLIIAYVIQSRIERTVINVCENSVNGVGTVPKFPLSFVLWGSISSLKLVSFKYTYNDKFSIDVVDGNIIVINAFGNQHKVYAMDADRIRAAIMSQKNESARIVVNNVREKEVLVSDSNRPEVEKKSLEEILNSFKDSQRSAVEWFETWTTLLGEDAHSLILAAVSQDRADVLELFAARKVDFKEKDAKGETLIHFAAYQGSLKVMQWLHQHDLDINERSGNGDVPICIAAGCGHVETVKWLLDNGVDVNSEGRHGNTPMHQAALNGRVEVMKFLRSRGADISLRNRVDHSPLESAIMNGQTDSIKCLVNEMGVNVETKNKTGMTAMFVAAMGGKIDSIKCLAKLGAKVDATDKNGWTPLFKAAEGGHADCVECLVNLVEPAKRKAYLNAVDIIGATSVFVAAIGGDPEIINCLVSLGADVDAPIKNGMTPIFAAVDNNKLAGVKCLVENGANLGVKMQGMTPLDFAIKNGRTEIAEYLRNQLKKGEPRISDNEELSALSAVVDEYERDIKTGKISVVKLVAYIDTGTTDAQITAKTQECVGMMQSKMERVNLLYLKGLKDKYPNDPIVGELIRRAAKCYLELTEISFSMSEELIAPEERWVVHEQIQAALMETRNMVARFVG